MTRFASLTAGLLARKGAAEPAGSPFADQLQTRVSATGPDMNPLSGPLRPGGHARINGSSRAAYAFSDSGTHCGTDVDLPPVIDTLPKEDYPGVACHPPAVPGSDDPAKTFHVNLRLKRPRFVKLKLSAALLRRPAQDIVSEALDQWFEKLPAEVLGDCTCMRANAD